MAGDNRTWLALSVGPSGDASSRQTTKAAASTVAMMLLLDEVVLSCR